MLPIWITLIFIGSFFVSIPFFTQHMFRSSYYHLIRYHQINLLIISFYLGLLYYSKYGFNASFLVLNQTEYFMMGLPMVLFLMFGLKIWIPEIYKTYVETYLIWVFWIYFSIGYYLTKFIYV